MRQQTRELALASVLGALAVLFLFLGGVLPLALYACPLLASACLLPVREECRASYQWCCFFAAAILGLLLGPDKESALLFCFLGYYPLVQPSFDAIGSRALRFLTKLGLYVLAVGAMYALLVFVFRLDAVTAELAATAPWLIGRPLRSARCCSFSMTSCCAASRGCTEGGREDNKEVGRSHTVPADFLCSYASSFGCSFALR